jgi:hypothetical protein
MIDRPTAMTQQRAVLRHDAVFHIRTNLEFHRTSTCG